MTNDTPRPKTIHDILIKLALDILDNDQSDLYDEQKSDVVEAKQAIEFIYQDGLLRAELDEQYLVLGWFEDTHRLEKPVVGVKRRIAVLERMLGLTEPDKPDRAVAS